MLGDTHHHSGSEQALGYFRDDCRLCRSRNMETFLDFGMQPHSDGFVHQEDLLKAERYFPLTTQLCRDCGQVQINYIVTPAYLYGRDYVYDSSTTATGRQHFMSMAKDIVQTYHIPSDGLVVDIGSNVGLLLSGFREQGMRVQGVDPTPTMTAIAIQNGIDTLVECFSAKVAEKIVVSKGKAAIITGTNVFAHIDDLDDVMHGVDALLDENGILVVEAPYLKNLLDDFEYDTIYHQHLSYLSVAPLVGFMKRFGMEIFDVQSTQIHGGSIRMFVARHGTRTIQPIVDEMIAQEAKAGIHTLVRMQEFARSVEHHRRQLIRLLVELKNKGHSLAGIGAPAKGSTLLNFCSINTSLIDFVTEKNTFKIGRYTPGTHIPIVSDATLLEQMPDYALILPWNFAPEIVKNLHAYTEKGGTFIVPIPSPILL